MDYMIFDIAGNAVESFGSEREALAALISLASDNHEAVRHLVVLAFDEDGDAVGEPVTVADVRPELATTLDVEDGWCIQPRLTIGGPWTQAKRLAWRPSGALV